MAYDLLGTPSFLAEPAFLPRVTVHDGRAIEEAMAGTLLRPPVSIKGAIVEASFANRDPELLQRLREAGVGYVIDPQAVRFATEAHLEIERIKSLPYAPRRPLVPGEASVELDAYVESARLAEPAPAMASKIPRTL